MDKDILNSVTTSLSSLISESYFPDTFLICKDGHININRILVGLVFPYLHDTLPFSTMSDVTLVLDDFTLEQFLVKVSSALQGPELNYSNMLVNRKTNVEVHEDEVDAIVSEIDAIQDRLSKVSHFETLAEGIFNSESSGDQRKDNDSNHNNDVFSKSVMEPNTKNDLIKMNRIEALNAILIDNEKGTVRTQDVKRFDTNFDPSRNWVKNDTKTYNKDLENNADVKTGKNEIINSSFSNETYNSENTQAEDNEFEGEENDLNVSLECKAGEAYRAEEHEKEVDTEVTHETDKNKHDTKYDKSLMLQKVLNVNMKFPSIALTMSYIYNWCDDNLSPLVIKEGHVNKYESTNTLVLACPHEDQACPAKLVVIDEAGDFKISELHLEHANHELSYKLYQMFKKPEEIKDIEADHKSIIKGLFQCGFTMIDMKIYFSGYNNSGIGFEEVINFCKEKEEANKKTENQCKLCEENFKSESRLINHMDLFHMVEMPVKCQKCKNISANRQEHRAHVVEFHNPKVPCPHCGKFVGKDGLKAHITVTHGTDTKEKFVCPICGFQTKKKYFLEVHMTKHSDKKKFECKQCDKKFTWGSSLKSHMLAAHCENTQKYVCDICTHIFKDGANLKKHMFTHKEEKPHNCNKCGKGWIRADFLKNHKCTFSVKP